MDFAKKHKLLLLIVGVIAIGLVVWWGMRDQPLSLQTVADGTVVPMRLAGREVDIEVVKTPESIQQGLSGRPEIGSDGMLFVLGRDRFPRFWMKEMLFDLDLVWLRDMKIVEITRQVPYPLPGVPLDELPLYSPATPVNQVLEIPGGQAANWGLSVGDQLEFR